MSTQRVGVLMMDVDDVGDIFETLNMVGLKQSHFSWDVTPSSWLGGTTSRTDKGYLETNRVGNEIRVVGIEIGINADLVSEEGGTTTETSPTTWTNTAAWNGPSVFRLVLVVNQKFSKGDDVSARNEIWSEPTNPGSLLRSTAMFSGYSVIFDKSYCLTALGDRILDHVFIDCDFIQYFDDASSYPNHNDLEVWWFLGTGEYSNPTVDLAIRRWYYDN